MAGVVWHDLMSTDPAGAAGFYGELFGWTCRDGRFWRGREAVAGIVAFDPALGWPAHWLPYVEGDVDAAVATAMVHHGAPLHPPTEAGEGRFAVVADPDGAVFGLVSGARTAGATSGAGAFVWDELLCEDDAVRSFYAKVLGATVGIVDMGPLGAGWALKRDGQPFMSILRSPLAAPGFWLPYVSGDPDVAAHKVRDLGGAVLSAVVELEGVGRFCVCVDPSGANFAVLA